MATTGGPKIPGITNGLVLYLDAANDESYVSGTTWYNLVNNNINGSLINGTVISNIGNKTASAVFDGVDDRVSIANFDYGRSGCTIAAWVKYNISRPGYNEGIVTKWQTGGGVANEFILTSSNSGGIAPYYATFSIQNSNNQFVAAQNTSIIMNVGQWYYVVGTFDGLKSRIYLNGGNEVTSSITSSSTTIKTITAQPIALASFGSVFNYNTNCNIAITQIYNRALTAEEILQNYNATKSRFQ